MLHEAPVLGPETDLRAGEDYGRQIVDAFRSVAIRFRDGQVVDRARGIGDALFVIGRLALNELDRGFDVLANVWDKMESGDFTEEDLAEVID